MLAAFWLLTVLFELPLSIALLAMSPAAAMFVLGVILVVFLVCKFLKLHVCAQAVFPHATTRRVVETLLCPLFVIVTDIDTARVVVVRSVYC